MGSKICMNDACRATTTSEWKKGWGLKSGGFAKLCYACGSAFEKSVYCEKFHSEESGWRECRICGKGVHCGCIASRNLHEYMDYGGIACITCAKRLEIQPQQQIQVPNNVPNGTLVTKNSTGNRIDDDKFSTERLLQLTKAIRVNDVTSALEQLKREDIPLKTPESSKRIPNPSPGFVKSDNIRPKQGVKDMFESLNFSLATPFGSSPPFSGGIVEGSEQSKASFQRTRHIFPKPPKLGPTVETNKGSVSQTRVARPPADGRGRNQLLPRYWPRITDQELQQLSGDLKSTIVPLFEKILSASDAGRIGRLVLPKACAEAYFPTINQSEGIPIRIQDIKGKEWTFQFRFWPNNNSRMYVLEGVTPCIQNMQLQAGDTVTFSRIDPGGQLVIGCRKATNNADVQDFQTAVVPNGDSQGETSSSGVADNRLSNGGIAPDDSFQPHMSMSEKKKARNIKNKRLLMHNDDAMELRITWEEAQELFRPSPSAEATVVMVEDHEFEEYEEPPVFGKRTIFVSRPSGDQEQLAQCDSCSKWRRLPVHALLSANWTCLDNIWDPNRCSCSAPEDTNPRDLDFFGTNKGSNQDYKKRRTSESKAASTEGEPSGLDALATVAVLGDNIGDLAESSVGATTRHPRHRPGCSCIVCIQPPSGKGKHDPSCKCNVCLTVKRRFKTLMMRKKKRQSEREAELAQEKDNKGPAKLDFEREDNSNNNKKNDTDNNNNNNNNNNNSNSNSNSNMDNHNIENETNTAELDLNCDPHREDEMLAEAASMSLTTLMNAATFPLDMYAGPELDPNGGPQLGPCLVSRNSGGSEDNVVADEDVGEENNREDGQV